MGQVGGRAGGRDGAELPASPSAGGGGATRCCCSPAAAGSRRCCHRAADALFLPALFLPACRACGLLCCRRQPVAPGWAVRHRGGSTAGSARAQVWRRLCGAACQGCAGHATGERWWSGRLKKGPHHGLCPAAPCA